MDLEIFRGKKVLVTGHTGFKGSWLSIWLLSCGAEVAGYGLDPKTERDNFLVTNLKNRMRDYRGDIRNRAKLKEVFEKEKPEIIFHLAAQPLVLESLSDPYNTFEVNIQGTVNVLEEFRNSTEARSMVVITTDKVYKNVNKEQGYTENDRLGGSDPYSASKSAVELVAASYNRCYFENHETKKLVTARAGNVIGGGDWSENRIIPDCIRAFEKKKRLLIRNPAAIRPWQFVLEPLQGYLLLAYKSLINGSPLDLSWNFGPAAGDCIPVLDLVKKMIAQRGDGGYELGTPPDNSKEAKMLLLDSSKALKDLNWKQVLSIDEAVRMTMDWYNAYQKNCIYELCLDQITEYNNKWSLKN